MYSVFNMLLQNVFMNFQQFLMKLEGVTSVRPLPDKQLVENYVKAYYLPETALEDWVMENSSHYTSKQLTSLTSTMTHVSKKTRNKISLMLEEHGSNKS